MATTIRLQWYNNSIVSTTTYTVFVIVIFMYKCVLLLLYTNEIVTLIIVDLRSSPLLV